MAPNGATYLADGTTVRVVDAAGVIRTVLGAHFHNTDWNPMPCDQVLDPEKVIVSFANFDRLKSFTRMF